MKNKDLNKTFSVMSTDPASQKVYITECPRGYVQACDHAKSLLEAGHMHVQISITFERAE